jgi:ribonuclease HI
VGLTIYVDGGARGNPGPAGAGIVIRDDAGRALYEAGYYLGRQTNNAAEYHALIRALERAGREGNQPVTIHSDSELLVRQLTGQYQVKSATLAPLFHQAQMLLLKMGRWTIRHVRREENQRADQLANLAMDERRDVIVLDAGQGQVAPAPARSAARKPAAQKAAVRGTTRPVVQVSVSRHPQAGCCPAGGLDHDVFTIGATLPRGLCVYAAHALLPTLLGMLNTEPEEFAAVPTLSVRCTNPACGAEFKLSPVRSPNGEK